MLPQRKELTLGNNPEGIRKLEEVIPDISSDEEEVITISEINKKSERISLSNVLKPLTGAVTWDAIIIDENSRINMKIKGFSEEDIEKQINEQLALFRYKDDYVIKRIICKSIVSLVQADDSAEEKPAHEIAIASTSASNFVQPIDISAPSTSRELPYYTEVCTNDAESPSTSSQELTQLIIELTTGETIVITEGELIAVPTETLHDDTQLYVLFRFDSSARLTALNTEELEALNLSVVPTDK